MSPPHLGHLSVLEGARTCLQGKGLRVVGGFLSPTHDAYVKDKLNRAGYSHIPDTHRCAMVREMTATSPWLCEGLAETLASDFVDYPQVCAEAVGIIRAFVAQDVELAPFAERIDVWYACGADHADRCHIWQAPPFRYTGTVVVGRPGTKGQATEVDNRHYHYVSVPEDTVDISSTAIRELMLENKPVDKLVGPRVNNYMQKNNIRVVYKFAK